MPAPVEKRVTIAVSGVYQYGARELPALKVGPVPEQHKSRTVFGVYRPATVLQAAVADGVFNSLPIIKDHIPQGVQPSNFRDYALGITGDSATIEMLDEKNEVGVVSMAHIFDEEGMGMYFSGRKQVSPMYGAGFHWEDGVASDGTPFQIIMDKINWANHLAIPSRGRGGEDAVIDHDGMLAQLPVAAMMKRVYGVVSDFDGAGFRVELENLVKARTSLTEDMICSKLDELRSMVWELPYDDERRLLDRYMDDVPRIKGEEDDTVAMTMVKIIADLYEKLNSKTVLEIMKEQEKEMKKKDGQSSDANAEEDKDKKDSQTDGNAKDEDAKSEAKEDQKVAEMSAEMVAEWNAFHKHLQSGAFADGMGALSTHMGSGGKIADWDPAAKKDEGKSEDDESKAEEKKEEKKDEEKGGSASDSGMTLGGEGSTGPTGFGKALFEKIHGKKEK